MECQCAGCYPEREARRQHREKMAQLEKLADLLLSKKSGDDKSSDEEAFISKASSFLFGDK